MSTPGMLLNEVDDSKEGIEKYLKRNPDTCFIAVSPLGIINTLFYRDLAIKQCIINWICHSPLS